MSKKANGIESAEYAERRQDILRVLEDQRKPLTRLDMKKLGVEADRKSLRQLEKFEMIEKQEHRLDNAKPYLDKKSNKVIKVLGTRYYTYSLVV